MRHFLQNNKTRRGATRVAPEDARASRSYHWRAVAALALVPLLWVVFNTPSNEGRQPVPENSPQPLAHTEPTPSVSLAPLPEAVPEPPPQPEWQEQRVREGDNLSLIFARAGFTDRDVYEVSRTDGGQALRKIFPGQTIAFLTDNSRRLQTVRHVESPLRWTDFVRTDSGYQSTVTERKTETREQSASLRIDSSLFLAGQTAGLSSRVIMDLAAIFGGVIDFALDPRQGDTIELIYEEQWLDGKKYADGNILAAAFTNRGQTYDAYRYRDREGDVSYYNGEGVSMRKAFLKAPLDFTRVSSNFNPNRLHPIYKTRRPHRGTDYAAPRGTPVYAAGDGRVIEAGYTRPNGNFVFIQHGETYKTHYLHLHRIKVKQGQRVKQGETIGTVGSTGSATGPHLHYEFLVNGVHRNPRRVHKVLPKARSLPESELPHFKATVQSPLQQLATLRQRSRLALGQTPAGNAGGE